MTLCDLTGRRHRGVAPCFSKSDPAGFPAPAVASHCSNQKGSSKAGPAGPASIIRSRVLSRHPSTEPSAWSEPRFIARTAAATLDTSLMTALPRPISASLEDLGRVTRDREFEAGFPRLASLLETKLHSSRSIGQVARQWAEN